MRWIVGLALVLAALGCLFLVWYAESLVVVSIAFVAILLVAVAAHELDPPNRRG